MYRLMRYIRLFFILLFALRPVGPERGIVVPFVRHRLRRRGIQPFDSSILNIVKAYKYFGVYLDGFIDFKLALKTLAKSASRALGSIINKYYNED